MRTRTLPLVIILSMLNLPLAFSESAAGDWTTIDDVTGEKGAVVNLVETDGVLNGTIAEVLSKSGDGGVYGGVCSKCDNEFKDKPIKGLQFIWGLKDKGNGVWDDGRILDARSGKIYHAKVTVKGDKLYVRGYIGVAMLGRTQVWIR